MSADLLELSNMIELWIAHDRQRLAGDEAALKVAEEAVANARRSLAWCLAHREVFR